MNHPKVVSGFIRAVKNAISRGFSEITLDFKSIDRHIFPNAYVPIVGIINYYKEQGIHFKPINVPSLINKMGCFEARKYSQEDDVLNSTWSFASAEDISVLVDSYIQKLSTLDTYPKGVLTAIEWALN